jgi:HK97 family phage major capsid protein
MPDIEDVLEDAESIGDNVKSLKDDMEKDLADVRKIAEDAPKVFAASEQFKKDVEALTAGMLEKHDAIAPKVKALTDGALKALTERMDDIEKKLNLGRLGGGWGYGDDGRKAAEAFARDAKARRGELKTDFDPDKVDLEEINSYCRAFPVYLHKDEKGLQGAETKAMSVGSDPDGGYMVTPAIGSIINGVHFETSPMRAIANIETISSDAIEYTRDDDESFRRLGRRAGGSARDRRRHAAHSGARALCQSEGDEAARGPGKPCTVTLSAFIRRMSIAMLDSGPSLR